MAAAAIRFEGLEKGYLRAGKRELVFRGISGEFRYGEITLITGQNGIGKTVLAHILSGLDTPDRGTVAIDGRLFTVDVPSSRLTRTKAKSLGVEYLPQHLPRPKELSGYELLALDSKGIFFRTKRLQRSFQDAIADYGLGFTIDLSVPLRKLTAANLQRLYLARGLIVGSKVLILDEPTADLPAGDVPQLTSMLETLAERGKCVVMIAHPQQYHFGNENLWVLTRQGLQRREAPTLPEIAVPRPADRYRSIQPQALRLRLGGPNELLLVPSGSIVVVHGPPSDDFYSLAESLGTSPELYLEAFKTVPERRIRSVYLPQDAGRSLIGPSLDLVENALMTHWTTEPGVLLWKWYIRRRAAYDRPTRKVLEDVDVQPRDDIEFLAGNLSGGNRQRLVVGRAVHGGFDVFVAVGVFRGLDDQGIETVTRLLLRLAAEGKTTFLFSVGPGIEDHLADIVLTYSGRALHVSRNELPS